MHQAMAATMEACVLEIRRVQQEARSTESRYVRAGDDCAAFTQGWTGPKEVDGKKVEGFWRSHQVPIGDVKTPEHFAKLEEWLKSYKVEELFDKTARCCPS